MGAPIKMFRKEPSREFVEHILREMGFLGLHDLRWFSKDEIGVSKLEEWLPDLETYYLPCKSRRFIHTWTDVSILTILRHILACHQYTLHKEERLYKGAKQLLYQIQPLTGQFDLSGASLQVNFD